MALYLHPKEGKTPKPDNHPEELSNFSPEARSCTSKCSLYHQKRFTQDWLGSKFKEESQQKATNPTLHGARITASWILTSCGCWSNGIRCQNGCHSCCCHWSTSTENGFLWKEILKVRRLHLKSILSMEPSRTDRIEHKFRTISSPKI